MLKSSQLLAAWKSHAPFWAAGTTMINTVISGLPIYTMSLFKIPKTIRNKMDSIVKIRTKPITMLQLLGRTQVKFNPWSRVQEVRGH